MDDTRSAFAHKSDHGTMFFSGRQSAKACVCFFALLTKEWLGFAGKLSMQMTKEEI